MFFSSHKAHEKAEDYLGELTIQDVTRFLDDMVSNRNLDRYMDELKHFHLEDDSIVPNPDGTVVHLNEKNFEKVNSS